MRIVELGDCSMVIMKDSEDPPWVSVGDVYRRAQKQHAKIVVAVPNNVPYGYTFQKASDCVYTAGRLILYFDKKVKPDFHLHDKVTLNLFSFDLGK